MHFGLPESSKQSLPVVEQVTPRHGLCLFNGVKNCLKFKALTEEILYLRHGAWHSQNHRSSWQSRPHNGTAQLQYFHHKRHARRSRRLSVFPCVYRMLFRIRKWNCKLLRRTWKVFRVRQTRQYKYSSKDSRQIGRAHKQNSQNGCHNLLAKIHNHQ